MQYQLKRNSSFTVKIVVSLLLIVALVLPYGGWGSGKVEAASIYGWDKYTISSNSSWGLTFLGEEANGGGVTNNGCYSYELNAVTGELKMDTCGDWTYYAGSTWNAPPGTILYQKIATRNTDYCTPMEGGGEAHCWTTNTTFYGKTESFSQTQGAYINTVTSSLGNEYPVNGVKDGYWYVYKGLVNNEPVIKIENIDKIILSENEGYNKLVIKGTVQDLDVGDTLILYYSIDGTSHTAMNFSSSLADGSNQAFTKSISIDSTIPVGVNTIRVWVEDGNGGKSVEETMTFIVDKISPSISFTNILEDEIKYGQFIPQISITDTSAISSTMTLNGQIYNGEPISKSGDYTLAVEATDIVDNVSNKTISFTLNEKPQSNKPFVTQTINKFDELTLPISEYFTDPENDLLTVTITNSNPTVASLTTDNDELIVKALKQGSASITVKVNDGHSDSDTLTFNVDVGTRSPELAIKNDSWILADDSTDVVLTGTVKDEDKEKVNVSGTLNNVMKQFEITETTGNEDDWSLTWTDSDLPIGVYQTIEVSAQDEFGGKSAATFNKTIVKVTGNKESYMPILDNYEIDLGKVPNDWTISEHTLIVEAYEAMKKLAETNTDSSQADAENKVNLLAEGIVKEQYLRQIATASLDWLVANFDKATVVHYTRANVPGVTTDILAHTNELGQKYLKDKSVLVHGDVVLLAVIAKQFFDGAKENTATKWLNVKGTVVALEDGELKTSLLTNFIKSQEIK